ncbi:MAG: hypothetical protein Q7U57_16370 [Methylovulum sp.]|nr:hypothetical protein [Methylovulum sp.]
MKIKQTPPNLNRFFAGLGVFVFSAGTVAFVTDPYIMADIALIILGMALMISGLFARRSE